MNKKRKVRVKVVILAITYVIIALAIPTLVIGALVKFLFF